jgi:hypothetical protein
MSELGIILLQATIGGLSTVSGGGADVLTGGLDVGSGVLVVASARKLGPTERETRKPQHAALTNNASADDFDVLFTEADFQDAIRDYYAFAGRGLLVLEDGVAACNPSNKIEPDGVDEKGRKFRIANDIGNSQLAVIAMCWFAVRQAGFAQQLTAFEELADPRILSVGLPGEPGAPREIVRYEMGGKLPIGRDGWPV